MRANGEGKGIKMFLIANPVSTWVFVIVAIILLSIAVGVLSEDRKTSIVLVVAALVFVGLWLFSASHRIVSVNYQGVIFSGNDGKVLNQVKSGLANKPFFGWISEFPDVTNQEMCPVFSSSASGGYGVNITLCFYYNASAVDWSNQIGLSGKVNFEEIQSIWVNQLAQIVAETVKDFQIADLTNKRQQVAERLFNKTQPFFNNYGVTLNQVVVNNWDFSNPEVGKLFDDTIQAQTIQAQEDAKLKASETARKRQLYEAETEVLLATEKAKVAKSLGLDSDAMVQYLWIQALSDSGKMPEMLILTTANQPVIPSNRVELIETKTITK